MSPPSTTPRRSVYADRLRAFPDLALVDDAAFTRRGQWRDFFRQRIGPKFDGRVVLEIGCAEGALLARVAATHTNTAFIGLDWKYKALHDAADRLTRQGAPNVSLLRARAQDLPRIFADRELDEIWVFHPDPCDRDVELKNRLIAPAFLASAHQALRGPESVLALKTDHPGYYQWVLGLFGLPQPPWFADPRRPGAPRVKAAELMPLADVPPASDTARTLFDVTANSADFWNDPPAIAHTSTRAFTGEVTAFESRFLRKRLPIYYLELRPR